MISMSEFYKLKLKWGKAKLDDRSKLVLNLRKIQYTRKEIGIMLGVSPERVRQIQEKAETILFKSRRGRKEMLALQKQQDQLRKRMGF